MKKKWDWHSYILNGRKQTQFSVCCPTTAKCLEEIGEDLFCDTPFSFAFFSTLQGNATIKVRILQCYIVCIPFLISFFFSQMMILHVMFSIKGAYGANEFTITHSSTLDNTYWKRQMWYSCWFSKEKLDQWKGNSFG
jgi:hypothetical protein